MTKDRSSLELDEIDNKRYCQLCRKDYSIETGLTTIKAHFKRDHPTYGIILCIIFNQV